MKLAGTWSFIHQLCNAGTSGWISWASRTTVYQSRKPTAALTTSITKAPIERVLYCSS
ncbi:hypothetical protein FQZ97_1192520 [compost metagenome]